MEMGTMKENDSYFWSGHWMDGSAVSELRWETPVEEQVWGDEFHLGHVERAVGSIPTSTVDNIIMS